MVPVGDNSNVRIDKDVTMQTKGRLVNAPVFQAAMHECES